MAKKGCEQSDSVAQTLLHTPFGMLNKVEDVSEFCLYDGSRLTSTASRGLVGVVFLVLASSVSLEPTLLEPSALPGEASMQHMAGRWRLTLSSWRFGNNPRRARSGAKRFLTPLSCGIKCSFLLHSVLKSEFTGRSAS